MISDLEHGRPRVVADLGRIPACWEDHSVIFFANLLSLFFGNAGGARLLSDEIRCVDSYGGRLLPVLGLIFGGSHNVLVLERDPDPTLTRFFARIGLDLPRIEILRRDDFLQLGRLLENDATADHPLLQKLRHAPAATIDGFVTDRTIARIATRLGKTSLSTASGSHRGNNKLLLHERLEEVGLPTFPTRLAGSDQEVAEAVADFGRHDYRHAVIKAQIGASGIGLLKVAAGSDPPSLPEAFFHEGPCLVQAWMEPGVHAIESVLSPSVQIFVGEDVVQLYDLTEQILDPAANIHQGNESPPPYLEDHADLEGELLRQAGEAGLWLHQQGYRGVASVDHLVTIGVDGASTVFVCEINARVTGATYPAVLARRFQPDGSWRMRNLEFAVPLEGGQLLECLKNQNELFDPETGRGILPVNFNLEPDGLVKKGQFLALSDNLTDCRHLLDNAREDLPVVWDYTHDR